MINDGYRSILMALIMIFLTVDNVITVTILVIKLVPLVVDLEEFIQMKKKLNTISYFISIVLSN